MVWERVLQVAKANDLTFPSQYNNKRKVAFICKVLPWLVEYARDMTANDLKMKPENVSIQQIQDYILDDMDFDVIDCSKLVEAMREL